MRLHVDAVGRHRAGPEAAMVADYLARTARTGRGVGLSGATLTEVEARKPATPAREADALRRAIPEGATLVALDERGRTMTSPAFAERIAGWRDGGVRDAVFAIGGADGLDPDLRAGAALAVSFGPMVWPHLLARVMLAEQLYRAAAILAGAPYHRQ